MNFDKLSNAIDNRDMKVKDLLKGMEEYGVKLSRASYYNRMNGKAEFTRSEIVAIAKVLKLDEENTNRIFFEDYVS